MLSNQKHIQGVQVPKYRPIMENKLIFRMQEVKMATICKGVFHGLIFQTISHNQHVEKDF